MMGPTMDNKKSFPESLISGNNITVRKNRMIPVRTSVQRFMATFVSRKNN